MTAIDVKELNNSSIYVHIPFCVSKCPYCDFNSVATDCVPEDRYVKSIISELKNALKTKRPDVRHTDIKTLYFGGGTPSIFSPASIGRIVEATTNTTGLPGEITLEVNPDTVDLSKLKGFKKAGINRLSIGVQSFNDEILKALGRTHGAGRAKKAFSDAREAGFSNIGIDLIFGTPEQSIADWELTLAQTIRLNPEHVSIYGMTIEEGTPFFGLQQSGSLALPTEDEELAMYRLGTDTLKKAGFSHYEISNFARPGLESRHNTLYWTGGDYTGLGAGAHSYDSQSGAWGRRWWNIKDPVRYMQAIEEKGNATEGEENLTKEDAMTERLFLTLRLIGVNGAIDESEFEKKFSINPKQALLQWDRLTGAGLVESKNGKLRLTEKGVLFSNEVF